MTAFGHVDHERVEFVPAKFVVHVERREKLACRACKGDAMTADRVSQPYLPLRVGPSVLAYLVESKCDDVLPIHRQCDQFARMGFELPPSTGYRYWRYVTDLTLPIADALLGTVLEDPVWVGIDDTRLDVLDRTRKGGKYRGHLWCFRASQGLVAYQFTESWAAAEIASTGKRDRTGSSPLPGSPSTVILAGAVSHLVWYRGQQPTTILLRMPTHRWHIVLSGHNTVLNQLFARRGVPVVSLCGMLVMVGCSDTTRPPILWEGTNLRFGTNADAVLCEGTLPHLDDFAGYIDDVLQGSSAKVDYYWLPDGDNEEFCGTGSLACVPSQAEAFSPFVIHQHELVHAVRWPHQLYLPLEEGLAELYSDDFNLTGTVAGNARNLLREHEHGNRLTLSEYPLAGHFVSYLRAEHGLASILEFDEASNVTDSYSRTQLLFGEVFGVELDIELARYATDYPRCSQGAYRDKSFDCGRNVFTAPAQVDEEVKQTVVMSCGDPRVLGVEGGQRWTTTTLDVQVPGTYFVVAGKSDNDYTWPIRFRPCDTSCFEEAAEAPTFQSQFFAGSLCLDRGRYLFQFTDDEDFDDYQIEVTMMSSTCK